MTAEEYKQKRSDLVVTRKKLNEARRELDETRCYDLFPAVDYSYVNVKMKQTLVGHNSLMVGITYLIYVDKIRLNASATKVRTDVSCTIHGQNEKWYSVDLSKMEVIDHGI